MGDLPAPVAGEVTACGICGSPDLDVLLDMGSQPLAERMGDGPAYPLMLLQCQECSLVQLSYIAPPEEVFPPDHPYATGNTRALREHFAELAGVLACHLDADDLAVDIGANDGTLLSALSAHQPGAYRLLGVEPTDQAKKCASRGIPVWQDFFGPEVGSGIPAMYGRAKVITACNVLAHVPDPHGFMMGVEHLLADDGVFVTENHDVASVLDGLQIDTIYHEHLRYYSVTSLSRLLGMHGLVITDVQKIGTHGGSFRVLARRPQRDLAGRALRAALDLRELLAACEGPIYGVGATTRATPLIWFARIQDYLSCVCEVPGSEKTGQDMPATKIPVVDEARLIADQPPYALLLSWHLADSIIPALRAKGYRGKFIIPLPEAVIADD